MKRKLILIGMLLLIPALSFAQNLGDIREQVRLRIKDSDSSRQRYTDTQLDKIINEGHRFINATSWIVQKSTSVTLVIATTYYTLPTDVIEVNRVTRELSLLKETTKDQQDALSDGWEDVAGTPQYYYQDRANPDRIYVTPVPRTSASTGTLIIDYTAQANTLSSDSDEPFDGSDRYAAYHDVLTYYACYIAMLIEGDQRAQLYGQLFTEGLQVIRDTVGVKPNYNPGFSGKRSP